MNFSAVSIGEVFYLKVIFPSDWQRCHRFNLAISCQSHLGVAANKALQTDALRFAQNQSGSFGHSPVPKQELGNELKTEKAE
jgi:hypothetical protein